MMSMETTQNNYGVYLTLFTDTVNSLPEAGENAQGIRDALMVMGFTS